MLFWTFVGYSHLSPDIDLPCRGIRTSGRTCLLCGKAEEIFYDGEGRETERLLMDPEAGSYGCVVPAGSWHTLVALAPTVIMEVKDGRYVKTF